MHTILLGSSRHKFLVLSLPMVGSGTLPLSSLALQRHFYIHLILDIRMGDDLLREIVTDAPVFISFSRSVAVGLERI
jgi:hypothetical protein